MGRRRRDNAKKTDSLNLLAAQLKTIQEVIILLVFCVFSVLYLKEELNWNYLIGFFLIILAVFFIFKD